MGKRGGASVALRTGGGPNKQERCVVLKVGSDTGEMCLQCLGPGSGAIHRRDVCVSSDRAEHGGRMSVLSRQYARSVSAFSPYRATISEYTGERCLCFSRQEDYPMHGNIW